MSITQEIIEICQRHAGNRPVRSLDIEIGELSSVVPETIEFCFEACSSGTNLEGARLNIIRVPGIGLCKSCGARTPMQVLYGACNNCGSYLVIIESGEEMRVKEIEVDD
jgi:hydrogenase nickel incorporation protein HypA/HybF